MYKTHSSASNPVSTRDRERVKRGIARLESHAVVGRKWIDTVLDLDFSMDPGSKHHLLRFFFGSIDRGLILLYGFPDRKQATKEGLLLGYVSNNRDSERAGVSRKALEELELAWRMAAYLKRDWD